MKYIKERIDVLQKALNEIVYRNIALGWELYRETEIISDEIDDIQNICKHEDILDSEMVIQCSICNKVIHWKIIKLTP